MASPTVGTPPMIPVSIVREIAAYAGDTSKFVPPAVQLHIERLVVMRRLSAGRGGKDAR